MKTTTETAKNEGDCNRPIVFKKPTPHAALKKVIDWLGIGYESTITRKCDGKKITIRITEE